MAAVRNVEPVVRFCAVISRHHALRNHAINFLADQWGPCVARSDELEFEASGYYQATMGSQLIKTLVAFAGFVDPSGLADWKQQTNDWESNLATTGSYPESRPLNLDPGYLTQAKLVLATTKDRDHRIYLRDGIFAEVTLTYVARQWQSHRWSYPSYRTADVAEFANQCRAQLRAHLQATKSFRKAT
jgi:hypothetical protein